LALAEGVQIIMQTGRSLSLRITVLSLAALLALSAPVYAQTAGPAASSPRAATVTQGNGSQALAQAPGDQSDQSGGTPDLLIGGLIFGGLTAGAIVLSTTTPDSQKPVSP
jgi:hypothetical protein